MCQTFQMQIARFLLRQTQQGCSLVSAGRVSECRLLVQVRLDKES